MATVCPRASKRSASARTTGVFPAPPTSTFPTETTRSPGTRSARIHPRARAAVLACTPAAKHASATARGDSTSSRSTLSGRSG